jgi:lipopolysaccharide heptosyltransferase I
MTRSSPKKILIIKPSSLGDIVHSLPVLAVLHRCFPRAAIHWLVAKGFEGILEGHPMLEKLWVVHKDDWKKIAKVHSTVAELKKLFGGLRREGFDCVIDLQGLLRSGLITRATGAPMRLGFEEAKEGSTLFYTHRVRGGKDIHAVDRYLKAAAYLGCDTSRVEFPLPEFRGEGEVSLPVAGKYAVMVTGARKPVNRWPAERFGRLAAGLPVKTVVIGSRGDRALADEVVRVSEGKAVSVAGKTDLKGLVPVIKHAALMVSNDTGPMHIAVALGVPVFALFGPANPARTGPYGKGHKVIRKEIPCAPCYKRSCENPRCMDMITVEEVASVIGDFLRRKQ